jgi:hypothetical protein
MNKTLSTLLAAVAASVCLSAQAADDNAASADTAARADAKALKTQSEAQLKARKKVAEANEELNKADCKNALEGSARRACEKSAKAGARSEKADAQAVHEQEKQAIKAATKP